MGFIRQQEERMAIRLLNWQYEKTGTPPPPEAEVARRASQLVEEAHRIARQRGRNVLAILRELVEDIRKK
jgi:hypothetical protein